VKLKHVPCPSLINYGRERVLLTILMTAQLIIWLVRIWWFRNRN